MSSKMETQVIIGGKVFTLMGYESEEYLQKVASHINNKMAEFNKMDAFSRQPSEKQSVLMQINLVDDYFKAKKQITFLEEDIKSKENEIYDLKHELIAAQIKLENMEKSLKVLQTENNENMKKMIRMETELKEYKR